MSAGPRPGIRVRCIVIGANTSTDCPISVPAKPAGATPTIVNGFALSMIGEPITSKAAPNRRIQNPWLSTATGPRGPPDPGMVSSSFPIVVPSAALIPSTGK